MYKIPLQQTPDWQKKDENKLEPCLLEGEMLVEEPGDTYLNVEKYKKGYLWINGRNLGRYWDKGPSKQLFCPGVWMHKGVNKIQVLELL